MTDAIPIRQSVPGPGGRLGTRLARALNDSGLAYCHWKGRGKQDRWMTGRGDLDLLIDRAGAGRFAALLESMDFKHALAAPERLVAGVQSFLGFDREQGRLIHVHAHFSLVIGRPWVRYYRLPFADAVIRESVPGVPFRAPTPEFDLLLLLLRSSLLHDPRDGLRRAEPPWLRGARIEWSRLRQVGRGALVRLAARHLPEVTRDTLDRCAEALEPSCPVWRRLAARRALERELAAHAGRPAVESRVRRAVAGAVRVARAPAAGHGKRLASGGAVVALVGADGAGKSTCARALRGWLGTEILTRRAHLGRPPRSVLTLGVGALLKAVRYLDALRGRSGLNGVQAHLELLRYLCTARDRYRLYRRVRALATAGGVAVCERYPLPGNRVLVGPSRDQGRALSANSRSARLLRRWEARYYARITPPDLVFVLRVDPETAVRRKLDEPADYVRARAWALWETDWSESGAIVIDANRPIRDILAELRSRVWEAL
jgi:thymidylate kinase